MCHWSSMLMVGAGTRNVGKTELACHLIRSCARSGPVFGLKVTVICGDGQSCPRGGAGCSAGHAAVDAYRLLEETRTDTGKDTARMLGAGAQRVFWLCTRREHLPAATNALRERIPQDVPIVCESNSARNTIHPGLFVVIRPKLPAAIKDSCAANLHLADLVMTFDGAGWDFDAQRIVYDAGWTISEDAAAVILAGGRSARMGTDKALLDFDGKPLIARLADQLRPAFAEVLVSSNRPDTYSFLGLDVIPDDVPDLGPLSAIASSLARSSRERNFVVACDMPNVRLDVVRQLLALAHDHDIVMPVSASGQFEPLLAVYRRGVAAAAREIVAAGGRRVVELLTRMRAVHPRVPEECLANINTPEQYARVLAAWRAARSRQPTARPASGGGESSHRLLQSVER